MGRKKWPDSATLGEVREYLRNTWTDGCECPACTQLVKRYHRKFNHGMARCLLLLVKATKTQRPVDGWLHATRELLRFGVSAADNEYSKLAGWGLIEPHPSNADDMPKKRSRGLWRVTKLGFGVAYRRERVHKYLRLFNRTFMGTDGELVSIVEALGDRFDYGELMRGVPSDDEDEGDF